MWVTRALVAPREQHIVKADLSRIVGDYVQAQARTDTPPERVQAEMRRFMASLDGELQRRGRAGEVVLVGEAVLSKNVTDITADVAKAVLCLRRPAATARSDRRRPRQVGQVQPQGAPIALAAAPQAGIGPVPGTAIFGNSLLPRSEGSAQDTAAASPDPTLPGAAVSVFGRAAMAQALADGSPRAIVAGRARTCGQPWASFFAVAAALSGIADWRETTWPAHQPDHLAPQLGVRDPQDARPRAR
ncbi:TrbI F-type domain-containing protein [Sphingomonas panni]